MIVFAELFEQLRCFVNVLQFEKVSQWLNLNKLSKVICLSACHWILLRMFLNTWYGSICFHYFSYKTAYINNVSSQILFLV